MATWRSALSRHPQAEANRPVWLWPAMSGCCMPHGGAPLVDIHTREKSALHTTPSPLRFLCSSRSSSVGAALIRVFFTVSKKEGSAGALVPEGRGDGG